MMSDFTWSDKQTAAIETIDRQVLLSAAAGSGKTAVLAERAAHLVCDVQAAPRIRLEDLLVVTFTEAAAAEMRNRIADAIRNRLRARPGDPHLMQQLVRLDAAQISTIHAFCLQTLRRWFTYADIDPNAAVLDADEANLLRAEILERLFAELYDADDADGSRFRDLVTVYADGRDETLADLILRLDAFLQSVVDPHDWLDKALARFTHIDVHQLRADLVNRLAQAIDTQIDWYRDTAEQFRPFGPLGQFYAQRFEHYLENLREWRTRCDDPGQYDALAETIAEFKVMSLHGHKQVAGEQEDSSLDRLGKKMHKDMREKLLRRGLQGKFTGLDLARHADAIRTLEDPARTLVDLLRRFRQRYEREKQGSRQLDFADLERKTLDLLTTRHVNAPVQPVEQLRDRYRHLLLDEAQDINPVQHAILHALCTTDDAGHPKNLFSVGDLKQSIYRFRLAEPGLFRDAITELTDENNPGMCIPLRENFRSHPNLIQAINTIFERTMVPALGGITYDETHALVPRHDAADVFQIDDEPRFEIHLLQRKINRTARSENPEDDESDLLDLDAVEREAHLIARRIREWIPEHKPGPAPASDSDKTLNYRDICILLRSASQVAERIIRILRLYDIPAHTAAGSGFFDAVEIRDVLALLSILDNGRQDIPLAAVMRSPLFSDAFTESELARVRLVDLRCPFHVAVRAAASAHEIDPALHEKLERFFTCLRRYRSLAHRVPLPELLWHLYNDHGYLAYVSGLPDPAQRRANLLHLHQRARQFATFAKQGLHRFLRFLNGLRDADRSAPSAPTPGHDNAVAVMTIHKAKGLEFPVVFLADAAHKFNDNDTKGHVLNHRTEHLAMRVVLPEVRLAYPTLPHTRVADAIKLETRAEEIRLLYVATTRARQRFILVASVEPDLYKKQRSQWKNRRGPLPVLLLQSASNYIDWVLPAVAAQRHPKKHFHVTVYSAQEMADWPPPDDDRPRMPVDQLRRFAALAPFAPTSHEPRAADEHVQACINRLNFIYPGQAATGLPAIVAASEVHRRLDYLIEPGESAKRIHTERRPSPVAADRLEQDTARDRGIAVHRFLQHVDLARPCDLDDLREQLNGLIEAGTFPASDVDHLDLDAIAWFAATDLARRIRTSAGQLFHEWPFIAGFGPDLLDPDASHPNPDDRIIVRGIIDLLHVTDDGLEIIDYKTDALAPEAIPDRARMYKTQLDIYAHAARKIHRKPVTATHLVFLTPRRIETL